MAGGSTIDVHDMCTLDIDSGGAEEGDDAKACKGTGGDGDDSFTNRYRRFR